MSPHCSVLRPWKDQHHTLEINSALHVRVPEGVLLLAWSHVCQCFCVLSVCLGSRYGAIIRDMPVAGDVAMHVGSSSI